MRKIWDIPGGIHPPENKTQSTQRPIASLPLPEYFYLPLFQQVGAASRAIVDAGDKVLKGQLLATPGGSIGTAVHAPTSGNIIGIEEHAIPHPSGLKTTAIVLAADGRDEWLPCDGITDYRTVSPATLLEKVRAAGVTGLGGASFPTAVKLDINQQISTLIVNGAECEPYITCDDMLMRERAAAIIEGTLMVARLLGNPAELLIGVEDNKPEAIDILTAAASGTAIEVVEIPTKYPSGGRKQIIQILTGKEVSSGRRSGELGVMCLNVGTIYAIQRAIRFGEPLISRIVTVTGEACATNANYEVLLGTPIRDLLQHAGFNGDRCANLVMGGPLMGVNLLDLAMPVIQSTNCLVAGSQREFPPLPPAQPCIRCGMCAEACPASLLPQQLYWYSQAKDYDKAQAHSLFDCIECGACAYVCPSTIPLVQYYRATKAEIHKLEADRKKAERARQRFEFHQARLEKEEADKAAKREARRLAALEAQSKVSETSNTPATAEETKPQTADDLIKAAMARAEARKASPELQQAKLERGVEAARNRLQFAEENLAEAHREQATGEPVEKLLVKVDEAKRKLTEAEKKLAEFTPNPVETTAAPAVADRIAAKIQASPREQLESKIAGLQQRIATTEEKIAGATDETVKAALIGGLEKQQAKLAEALQELDALGDGGNVPVADAPALDAAASAIARAQEKAKAMAAMSPEQKLREAIESLSGRVEKARTKLASAREEGSEHMDALATALQKLEEKLASTQAELQRLSADDAEKVEKTP